MKAATIALVSFLFLGLISSGRPVEGINLCIKGRGSLKFSFILEYLKISHHYVNSCRVIGCEDNETWCTRVKPATCAKYSFFRKVCKKTCGQCPPSCKVDSDCDGFFMKCYNGVCRSSMQ